MSEGNAPPPFRRLAILAAAGLIAAAVTLLVAALDAEAEEIIGIASATGTTLKVRMLRPPGGGPFPLAIVNHGSPVNKSKRLDMDIPTFEAASNWLLERGFMVALPLRRGYGATGGPWLESYGSCSNADYYHAGLTTAEDIEAVIAALRGRQNVERDHILLIGQSAGGWGSLAMASRNPSGVLGVLNFAGGRGGHPDQGNCAAQRLVEAAGRYGSTTRIPSLWLYAANDKFFGPELAHKMFDAYTRAGGPGEFVALPAFGSDGHSVFAKGRAVWQPPVDKFLSGLKG